MLSLQAGEFGVGMTFAVASVVLPRSGSGDEIVPVGGLGGMSGVAGGKDAALVREFPGADMQVLPVAKLPGGDAAASVPVVLPPTEPRIRTGIAGARTSGGVVIAPGGMAVEPGIGAAPIVLIEVIGLAGVLVPVDVTLFTDGEISSAAGEQLMLVPGSVGSCASDGAAKVVAGAPGTVAAEKRLVNGPGPEKGDDTIAPGVVGSPIAVVPRVDVCARQPPQLSARNVVTSSNLRMSKQLSDFVTTSRAQAAAQPCRHLRCSPSD